MNLLKNKNVFVTGGASGIGRSIVEEFVKWGANVVIHYFSSESPAKELSQSIIVKGQRSLCVKADLRNEAEVSDMFKEIKDKFMHLDILINNAGDIIGRHKLEEMPYDFHKKVFSVNVDSVMLVTRAAIPLLKHRKEGASIVSVSSLAGRKGGHGGSLAYGAAKGAILAWTRSLSTELAPEGIRVNAVTPGFILGSRLHATHTTEDSKNATIKDIPLGRAGTCEDVARAVVFLASETNGFITGATLDINGGVYMA